jgi:hypothetical protein
VQDARRSGDGSVSGRGIKAALLPALVAFVVTGLLSPLYSTDEFKPGLTLWQAVVLWPIGALLLGFPAGLLGVLVRDKRVFRIGQVVLVVVAVVAMSATARSDDAQAGLIFLIIPWFGTPAVLCLILAQWFLRRRQYR